MKFHDDDVRKSFLALYSTVFKNFYNGRVSFLISQFISNDEIGFKPSTLKNSNHLIEFEELIPYAEDYLE